MCDQAKIRGGEAMQAGIASAEILRKHDAYDRVQAMRSEQFRDVRAQFSIVSGYGGTLVRRECRSLADLIDTLSASREPGVSVSVEITFPR